MSPPLALIPQLRDEGRRAARLVGLAIRAYQGFVSPLMPVGCKFYPSCSEYAFQAIERFGVRRGMALAARRLLRCRPFTAGGWDPVPESEDAAA